MFRGHNWGEVYDVIVKIIAGVVAILGYDFKKKSLEKWDFLQEKLFLLLANFIFHPRILSGHVKKWIAIKFFSVKKFPVEKSSVYYACNQSELMISISFNLWSGSGFKTWSMNLTLVEEIWINCIRAMP